MCIRDSGNLAQARAWFGGGAEVRERKLRGLLISAARAEIFNSILAARVVDGSWCMALAGDLMTVSYTHLRAHETVLDLVCRLLLEKKKYTKCSI